MLPTALFLPLLLLPTWQVRQLFLMFEGLQARGSRPLIFSMWTSVLDLLGRALETKARHWTRDPVPGFCSCDVGGVSTPSGGSHPSALCVCTPGAHPES